MTPKDGRLMEPRTEAGKALLDGFGPMPLPDAQELHRRSAMGRRTKLQAAILAIEAEAPDLAASTESGLDAPEEPIDTVAELRSIREAMHDATGAMAATLPVVLAVRAWRDTPLTGTATDRARTQQRLEQAILDALDGLDEYAEQHPAALGEQVKP